MYSKVLIMTFSLGTALAINADGAEANMPRLDAAQVAAFAPLRLAALSEDDLESLRQQWRTLPPEDREKLRRKLREEHGDGDEERFGQGFEYRRRDGDEKASQDTDPDYRWGRPRPGDKARKGRR